MNRDNYNRESRRYLTGKGPQSPESASSDKYFKSPKRVVPLKKIYTREKVSQDDNTQVDDFGNIVSDKYGDVYRDKAGNVILGKDGILRDPSGQVIKNVLGLPLKAKLPYAPTESKKKSVIKKKMEQDEVYLNADGNVDYDKYGIVKRNSKGVVVLGRDDIFRDPSGFALLDKRGIVLKKPKNVIYKKDTVEKIIPSKPGNFSDNDKDILLHLLNIRVPEGYYPQRDLVLKDLLDPGKKIIPNFPRLLLNSAPSFFLKYNTSGFIILNILSLILSEAIPYPRLKAKLTDEILKVLSTARKQISFLFAKYVLTKFKDDPDSLVILKNIPYTKIITLLIGALGIYKVSNNTNLFNNAFNLELKKLFSEGEVPLILDQDEVVTRQYLEKNDIISKGKSVINLKKIGLYTKQIDMDNKTKGITLIKNTILFGIFGVNLGLTIDICNPYTKSRTVKVVQIELIKDTASLNKVKEDSTLKVQEVLKKVSEKIKYFETIIDDINTYKKIRDLSQIIIQLREIVVIAKKFPEKYPENYIPNLEKKILNESSQLESNKKSLKNFRIDTENIATNILSYRNIGFSIKLTNILNFLKSREKALESSKKDIAKAIKENINAHKIIAEDTKSEIDTNLKKISALDGITDIFKVFEAINSLDIKNIKIL